jgi:uncharacterized protein (DUF1330 family)
MIAKYQLMIGVLVGATIGAAAVQGLHAQAKPKAYLVTETQILDAAGAIAVSQKIQGVIRAAGGRTLISNRGKVTAVVGDAPVRFGVSEWESIEKAQAYVKSPERMALEAERAKTIKTVRQFIIEEFQN